MIGRAHLDVNVCAHCNARCVSCSHASPFTKPWFMEVESMVNDLRRLKEVMRFEKIQLVGGEPTLHPKLIQFMEAAKESGIADRVTVITNGRLLPRMTAEFWSKLQAMQLSVYGNLPASIVELAEEKQKEHGFFLEIVPFPDFFKQFKTTPDDGVESFRNCHWKDDCYTVHQGFLYLCPQSLFFPAKFGSDSNAGLSLEGITEELVEQFITRSEPFEACKVCCGGYGEKAPWKEARTSAEWFKESQVSRYIPTEEEVQRMSE